MDKHTKREFRKELILLTMSIYIAAMLILGIIFTGISVKSFAEKAREDMFISLENIGIQLENRLLFMEDMIISIRHNSTLEQFLQGNQYQVQEVNSQFGDCVNLFSERNLVNSQYPFIEYIYIFNMQSSYINSFFYPVTVSGKQDITQKMKDCIKIFRQTDREYTYQVKENVIHITFYIYNQNMKSEGICVVALNLDAMQYMFKGLNKYPDHFWTISGYKRTHPLLLGPTSEVPDPRNYLMHQKDHGFGLHSVVGVKKNALYLSLVPTIITFIVVFLILLIGIAIVVYYVSSRFARPLKVISDNIREFGEGNLKTRLKGFDTQEFDHISTTFNKMADQINDLILQNYEKKLLATQSQVRFLQSQMNPHFMFNILTMIGMRAKMKGNDDIMEMLTAFSKLIQGKIFRKGEIKIPLSEEMELVGFYLYLQSNRFRDKISYQIHYANTGLEQLLIPRLCVESLVENAVSHGLEQKEGHGEIQIHIWEKEEHLFILVEDDGVGFDTQELASIDKKSDDRHAHIGLANIMELIPILYGNSYGIQIDSEPGKGTKVQIDLPVERGDETNVESNAGR